METLGRTLIPLGGKIGLVRKAPLEKSALSRVAQSGKPVKLDAETEAALAAVRGNSELALATQCERLESGRFSVVVGTDYSASSANLVAGLSQVSKALSQEIPTRHPMSTVSMGIFGGGDLVGVSKSTDILDSENHGTCTWNSTFNKFLQLLVRENLDPLRQNFFITFHDASPGQEGLHEAVHSLNENDAVMVICYVPSCCSSESDMAALQGLANSETGFKRGVFIDMSEMDYTNPEILKALVTQLVELLESANKAASKSSDSPEVASTRAHTTFKALVAGLVGELNSGRVRRPALGASRGFSMGQLTT